MKENEFGRPIHEYGYADSIIPGHSEHECHLCGRNGSMDKLDRHEVFFGPYREKSKRLGLWVYLCHDRCHLNGVHQHKATDLLLKAEAQDFAMKEYGWSEDEFREQFGKSYRLEGKP